MKLLRRIVPLMLALAGVVPSGTASGQETSSQYPTRLIKLIVPYPPGGGVDGLARPIAERLGRLWGQSVIIENKPGAATMIGGAEVAHAPADGHTLLFTSDSTITSNPHLFKKMSFDPIKELAPVTQLINLHQFVLVHPSVSANTMTELVALAKAKPGALNYGSYGKGSQPHLLFEMLGKETGTKIEQISYRGIAPAITAVLTGEVQTTLGSVAVAAAHIEAKKLKALAIGRRSRLPSHPQTPTLREAGYPDIEPLSWFGLFAPAGTPPAIVDKIQQAVASVLNEPEFKARFIDQAGHSGVGSTPSAFAADIQADLEAKRKLIAAAGIEAE